ncbi:MAG: LysR family transcriptional regulator [Planctomycetota bacterium]
MPRRKPQRKPNRRPAASNGRGEWQPGLRLWIEVPGHGSVGPGKLRLLAAIAATRSLSAAARRLRMSYRLAWEHLRQIEQRTGLRVVTPQRGGTGGGGTDLTPAGQALLAAYEAFRRDVETGTAEAFQRHFGQIGGTWPCESPCP